MPPTLDLFQTLPAPTIANLRQADRRWHQLRHQAQPPPALVIEEQATPLGGVDWDLIICGGTLGILLGTSLAQRGWRVLLLERGVLRGRDQEWNISRSELAVLLELELLTADQLETAISSEFKANRIQFEGGPAIWVEDVLTVGVDPVFLLATLKARFLAVGGHLQEQVSFTSATVHPDGVA
ncbi:MAG: FAD-binding oxidoreductase, partial [Acaryochloridaceae cyanobacterium CSU_5_19]|nr:FAD-binding oxidoreductase [Acaryochloridaceae cyanobacterium CSU_5_19]